jgi:hypothetical protein
LGDPYDFWRVRKSCQVKISKLLERYWILTCHLWRLLCIYL